MPARPERLFLDWNAGAPLAPTARAAMLEVLTLAGNPSSIHAEGRAARASVESARRRLAAGIGADPKAVAFSSGGTEANVTALAPGVTDASGVPCTRLVLSAVEHPSVLAGGRFAAGDVRRVAVDRDGRLDLADLGRALAEIDAGGERALVSVMVANNETGVLQPVREAAAIAHAHSALLHTDAVQALGKIHVDLADLGADVMTLSGHKIGAPRGVGAIVRAGEAIRIPPLLTGGGQEFGNRAEILVNTPAVSNLIRQGKLDQLETTMQAGSQFGMRTMDNAIEALLNQRAITGKEAYKKGISKSKFEPFKDQG
jgi:cysteine desulfurase